MLHINLVCWCCLWELIFVHNFNYPNLVTILLCMNFEFCFIIFYGECENGVCVVKTLRDFLRFVMVLFLLFSYLVTLLLISRCRFSAIWVKQMKNEMKRAKTSRLCKLFAQFFIDTKWFYSEDSECWVDLIRFDGYWFICSMHFVCWW